MKGEINTKITMPADEVMKMCKARIAAAMKKKAKAAADKAK